MGVAPCRWVHGDVKPENFLMGAECTSKSNRLYLVDLGLGEASSFIEETCSAASSPIPAAVLALLGHAAASESWLCRLSTTTTSSAGNSLLLGHGASSLHRSQHPSAEHVQLQLSLLVLILSGFLLPWAAPGFPVLQLHAFPLGLRCLQALCLLCSKQMAWPGWLPCAV